MAFFSVYSTFAIMIHVIFSGKVQRVGFRNTTARIARELGLLGWVRNLPDGTVEMEASGNADVLAILMQQLQNKFEITHIEHLQPTGEEIPKEFMIRY